MAVRPIDFKFLAILRLLLGAMLALTFFMPWTIDVEQNSGMGIVGFPPPPEKVYCSGFDYMVGCSPILDVDLLVQTWYVVLAPAIIIAALLISMKPRKEMQLLSMAVMPFAALPIAIWFLDVSPRIPDYLEVRLSYGVQVCVVLIIAYISLSLLGLKYTDLE